MVCIAKNKNQCNFELLGCYPQPSTIQSFWLDQEVYHSLFQLKIDTFQEQLSTHCNRLWVEGFGYLSELILFPTLEQNLICQFLLVSSVG